MKKWVVPVWAWGVLCSAAVQLIWLFPSQVLWVIWGLGLMSACWRILGKKIDLQLLILALLFGTWLGIFRTHAWLVAKQQVTNQEWQGLAVVVDERARNFGYILTLDWPAKNFFSQTTAEVAEPVPVGSLLQVECELEPRPWTEWWTEDHWEDTQGIAGSCAEVSSSLSENSLQFFDNPQFFLKVLAVRARGFIQQHIESSFDPPVSWLASGVLIGERSQWSRQFQELFQQVGLSHIVALSGWNVTLLSGLTVWILTRVGFHHRLAISGGLVIICVFVVMTGASASLVRAAIMFGVCMLARALSRPQPASRVLLATCALMVLANPPSILWDVSFHLSVLATFALVSTGFSFLESWEAPVWDTSQTLRTTLAVTLLTLPYLIWRFDRFSLVSIPLNVFILPVLPLATASAVIGVVPSFFGWSIPGWSWFFGLPLQLIITSAELAAQLSWASVSWE